MTQNDEIEIDLLKLMKALWKKAWAIVLVAGIFGGAMFTYGKYTYVPEYTAKITLYASYIDRQDFAIVNNAGTATLNNLVNTCIAVLDTRMNLETVIEETGLDLSYTDLSAMISTETIKNTELFTIDVSGENAEDVALLANTIGEVLPEKVSMVNSNSVVGIIDSALVPEAPNPNSITKNAAIAAVLGAFLVCGIVVVKELVTDWKANTEANEKMDPEES